MCLCVYFCLCTVAESYPPQYHLGITSPKYNGNSMMQCVHTYSQASTNICKVYKRQMEAHIQLVLIFKIFQIMIVNYKLKHFELTTLI